jgi:hypothetical protein
MLDPLYGARRRWSEPAPQPAEPIPIAAPYAGVRPLPPPLGQPFATMLRPTDVWRESEAPQRLPPPGLSPPEALRLKRLIAWYLALHPPEKPP